jgi:hypothetical protein
MCFIATVSASLHSSCNISVRYSRMDVIKKLHLKNCLCLVSGNHGRWRGWASAGLLGSLVIPWRGDGYSDIWPRKQICMGRYCTACRGCVFVFFCVFPFLCLFNFFPRFFSSFLGFFECFIGRLELIVLHFENISYSARCK